ncbi:unknown [Bacteroides finegoldii CAG:203]|nr:unknown [Bacteroides finegoldii CAG:203]
MMKSVGIIILEDFSIPFSTPFTMMKWVINKKETNQTTGRQGLLENCWKEVMNSSGVFPAKPFEAASNIYSSVHPATTE